MASKLLSNKIPNCVQFLRITCYLSKLIISYVKNGISFKIINSYFLKARMYQPIQFFTCPYSYMVWSELSGGILALTQIQVIISSSPPVTASLNGLNSILVRFLFQTSIYFIWPEKKWEAPLINKAFTHHFSSS